MTSTTLSPLSSVVAGSSASPPFDRVSTKTERVIDSADPAALAALATASALMASVTIRIGYPPIALTWA